jgi:hypothetical protein
MYLVGVFHLYPFKNKEISDYVVDKQHAFTVAALAKKSISYGSSPMAWCFIQTGI